MNLKTVKKNIIAKLDNWLATIPDEQLRKDVKKNLLVSGGSIASMLLNIPVNDYDIYIKDPEVLVRLCRYYSRPYQIFVMNGAFKDALVADLESAYKNFLTWKISEGKEGTIEDINNSYAISLRNLQPDQIKLFIYGSGLRVNQDKKPEDLRFDPLFFSPNAISLSNDLQIVCRFHGDAEAIHKNFDFIHATNYFTFEEGLVTNKAALESLLTRSLYYQGSLYPLTSIIRMKKFIKRGWNINAGEILKIMFQISQLNLTDPDTLAEQLIGVDVAYFSQLIDILRGVDPEKIDSHYLNTLIDRVFNESEEHEEE